MSFRGLPATTYESRKIFYKDIEDLLFYGFLSHPVYLGEDHVIHLRSLSQHDFFLMDKSFTKRSLERDWKQATLACAIWNVDGISLLEFPQQTLVRKKINDLLKRVPNRIIERLFSVLAGLLNRANTAVVDIDFFCKENVSRFLWLQQQETLKRSPNLNSVQKIWMYFNHYESLREKDDSLWEFSKFIASASNSDGVKKIQESDRSRRESEESKKNTMLDFFYYKKIGLAKEEEFKPYSEKYGIKQANTIEELEDEYKRWVMGEKDQHDLIVDQYKESIRMRYEEEKKRREQELQELQKAYEESQMTLPQGTQLIGLKPEEIEGFFRDKKNVKKVYDHDPFSMKERLTEKYINVEQVALGLETSSGELRERVSLTPEQRQSMLSHLQKEE